MKHKKPAAQSTAGAIDRLSEDIKYSQGFTKD